MFVIKRQYSDKTCDFAAFLLTSSPLRMSL